MPKKRTYKVGNETFDIPETEVAEFVAEYPDAMELSSFVVGKDTFDIPLQEVNDFLADNPNAKETFGEVKKKEVPKASLSATIGLQGGSKLPSQKESTPTVQSNTPLQGDVLEMAFAKPKEKTYTNDQRKEALKKAYKRTPLLPKLSDEQLDITISKGLEKNPERFDIVAQQIEEKDSEDKRISEMDAGEILHSQTVKYQSFKGDKNAEAVYNQSREGKIAKFTNDILNGKKLSNEDVLYFEKNAPKATEQILEVARGKNPNAYITSLNTAAVLLGKNNQESRQQSGFAKFQKDLLETQTELPNVELGNGDISNYISELDKREKDQIVEISKKYPQKTYQVKTADGFDTRIKPPSEEEKAEISQLQQSYQEKRNKIANAETFAFVTNNKATVTPLEAGEHWMKINQPTQYAVYVNGGKQSPEFKSDATKIGIAVLESSGDESLIKKATDEEKVFNEKYPNDIVEDTKRRLALERVKAEGGAGNLSNIDYMFVEEADKYIDQLPAENKEVYLKKIRPEAEALNNFSLIGLGKQKGGGRFDVPDGGGVFNEFIKGATEPLIGSVKTIAGLFESDKAKANRALKRAERPLFDRDAANDVIKSLDEKQKKQPLTVEEINQYNDAKDQLKLKTGLQTFADGTAHLTGNLVGFGGMTAGGASLVSGLLRSVGVGARTIGLVNKAERIAELASDLKTTSNVSGLITGYVSSYDDARQQAELLMPNSSVAEKRLFGVGIAMANSLSERIFKDEKIFDAFKKEVAPTMATLVREMSAGNITESSLQSALRKVITKYVPQSILENQKESIEESVVAISESLLKAGGIATGAIDSRDVNWKEENDAIKQTFLETTMYGSLSSGMAGISNVRREQLNKRMLYDLSTNKKELNTFRDVVRAQEVQGKMSNEEATQKIKTANTLENIADVTIPAIQRVKPLNEREKVELTNLILAERELNHEIEVNPTAKSLYEKKLKEIDEKKNKILKGEAIVDENYNVYTPEDWDKKQKGILVVETPNKKFEVHNKETIETFNTQEEADARVKEISETNNISTNATQNTQTPSAESTTVDGQSQMPQTETTVTENVAQPEITVPQPIQATLDDTPITITKTETGYTYDLGNGFIEEVTEEEHQQNLSDNSLKINQDATKKGNVTESDKSKYQDGNQSGKTEGSSNRNSSEQSGEIQKETITPINEKAGEIVTVNVGGKAITGMVEVDEGGKVTVSSGNKIFELDKDTPYADYASPVRIADNGEGITVNGETYVEQRFETDKDGNERVVLIKEDGTVNINTNPAIIEEIKYQTALQALDEMSDADAEKLLLNHESKRQTPTTSQEGTNQTDAGTPTKSEQEIRLEEAVQEIDLIENTALEDLQNSEKSAKLVTHENGKTYLVAKNEDGTYTATLNGRRVRKGNHLNNLIKQYEAQTKEQSDALIPKLQEQVNDLKKEVEEKLFGKTESEISPEIATTPTTNTPTNTVRPVAKDGKVIIDENGNMTDELKNQFEQLKKDNDLKGLDDLYSTVKIFLNGVAQSKGEKAISQFEALKKSIEDYAKELKPNTPTNQVEEIDRIENEEKRKEIKGYDKLKQVEKNRGYIETKETITDNDYEPDEVERKRTKAYKVEYAVKWSDNETSRDPDIEIFSTIDEAHKAAQAEGDWWNGGIDHLNIIEPVYKEVWLNKDGSEFEETGKMLNGDEFEETKEGKDFIKSLGFSKHENSSEVYVKYFGKRDDNSRELESEAYHSLGGDLETTFKADNGETYTIEHSGKGKYSTLRILDKKGNEIDSVQLRISDHTYNPQNNDDAAREGKFISVEIANVNSTKNKFRTSYSLQFDGTDRYDDILEAVKERLNEIIDTKIKFPTSTTPTNTEEQPIVETTPEKIFTYDKEGNIIEAEVLSKGDKTTSVKLPNGNQSVRANSEIFTSKEAAQKRIENETNESGTGTPQTISESIQPATSTEGKAEKGNTEGVRQSTERVSEDRSVKSTTILDNEKSQENENEITSPESESVVAGIESKAESDNEIELNEAIQEADAVIENAVKEIPKRNKAKKSVIKKVKEIVGLKRANLKEQKEDFLAQLRRIEGLVFINHNIPIGEREEIKKTFKTAIKNPFYLNDFQYMKDKGFEVDGQNVTIVVKDDGEFSFPINDILSVIDMVNKYFPSSESIKSKSESSAIRRPAPKYYTELAISRGNLKKSEQFVEAAQHNVDEAKRVLAQAKKDNDKSTQKSAEKLLEVFNDELQFQKGVLERAKDIDFEVENNPELAKIASDLDTGRRTVLDAVNKYGVKLNNKNAELALFLDDIDTNLGGLGKAENILLMQRTKADLALEQFRYKDGRAGFKKVTGNTNIVKFNRLKNELKAIDDKLAYLKKERKALDKISDTQQGNISLSKVEGDFAEVVDGFYSPLEKVIAETKFSKLPAKQWLDKFGKGDEAKWTGLTDWLSNQTGSVSKQDIQKFLKENRIEIVEVEKGKSLDKNYIDPRKNEDGNWDIYYNGEKIFVLDDYQAKDRAEAIEVVLDADIDWKGGTTKFSQYQLEGEKTNYKEILVTLPKKSFSDWLKENSKTFSEENQKEYESKYGSISNNDRNFKSSHFDEPNILVHLRMNTRVDAEGKNVLFLEEVQSDFAQAGRKQGFKLTEQEAGKAWEEADKEYAKFMKRMESKYGSEWESEMEKAEVEEETKLLDARENTKGGTIPQAPFVTDTNSWTKLGLKVALKEAVKQGADKIAWSTGTQQFDRWGSERIDWRKDEDDSGNPMWNITVNEQQGGNVFTGTDLESRSLKEKGININSKESLREILKRNLSRERNDTEIDKLTDRIWNRMQTEDSGTSLPRKEGMEAFYGVPSENKLGIVGNVAKSLFKQVPKTVDIFQSDKLASGWSVTVKDKQGYVSTQMFDSKSKGLAWLSEQEGLEVLSSDAEGKNYSTQHSIDITPELLRQVQVGLPLFKKGQLEISDRNDTKDFETDSKIEPTVENIQKRYPDAIVVGNESNLPSDIKNEVKKLNATGQVRALYDQRNGNIYIVANRFKTMGEVDGAYRHEKLGHSGVMEELGDKLDEYATSILDKPTPLQKVRLEKISKLYHGKPLSELTAKEKSNVGQEYIAQIAENPTKDAKLWDKIKQFVKDTLRKLGIKLNVSDREIKALINKVERGSNETTIKNNDAKLMLVPEGANFTEAELADLEVAKEMVIAGIPMDTVQQATNWTYDKKDGWQFEVDDSISKIQEEVLNRIDATYNLMESVGGHFYDNLIKDGYNVPFDEILEHTELFSKVPELKGKLITFRKDKNYPYLGVSYNNGNVEINIYNNEIESNNQASRRNSEDIAATIIHEIQHTIQSQFDKQMGGTPREYGYILHAAVKKISPEFRTEFLESGLTGTDLAYTLYRNLLGEKKAWDSQERKNLTSAERKNNPILSSQNEYSKSYELLQKEGMIDEDGNSLTPKEIADKYGIPFNPPTISFSLSEKPLSESNRATLDKLATEINNGTRTKQEVLDTINSLPPRFREKFTKYLESKIETPKQEPPKVPPIEKKEPIPIADDEAGIAHRFTEETRKALGLPEYERQTISDSELWDLAQKEIENGYNVAKLIKKMNDGILPTALEQTIIKRYLASLEKQIETDPSDENIAKYHLAVKASDAIGSELGRSLRSRKGGITKDDSLASYFIEEMEANQVDELTDSQKEKVTKEYEAIKEANRKLAEKLARLEIENARLQANKNISKSTKNTTKKEDLQKQKEDIKKSISDKLKEARSQINSAPIPYLNEIIAITPDVAKLVKVYVEEGIIKLDEIIDNIHAIVKEGSDNITKDDILDIIAGKYNAQKQTKSEIAKQLLDLRTQAKLITKLNELENGVQPIRESKKIERNKEIAALKKQIDEHYLTKLSTAKNTIQNQIDKLQQELETGDFLNKEKNQELVLDKEAIKLKDDLIALKKERAIRLLREQFKNRTPYEKVKDAIAEILNVPRTLMASMDFSAPLRQGIIASISHPRIAAKAFIEMFRQAGSQKRFDRWFSDVRESEMFSTMEKSGLFVADPHDLRLSAKEEQFMNNLVEKVPFIGGAIKFTGDVKIPFTKKIIGNLGDSGVRIPFTDKTIKTIGGLVKGSERAYVSFLNKMRVDLFMQGADVLQSMGKTYENSPKEYEGLASFINNSTGRGKINKLEAAAPILNGIFFSPRLIASRLNLLNPIYYAKLPSYARKMAIKDMIKFVSFGVTLLGLIKVTWGCEDDCKNCSDCVQVELDPRSTDFGKLKIGNTRYDIWGGFQQYVRIISQLISGQAKSAQTGKIRDITGEGVFGKDRGDVVSSFFRGKLAPIPASIIDLIKGRNIIGEPVDLKTAAQRALVPLIYNDVKEAIDEQGIKALATVGLPAAFGIGVNTYDNKKKK